MLDLGKIAETMTSLLSNGIAESAPADLLQGLADLGIDAQMLQGLDAGQVADLLAQHGIDIAGLAPGQLSNLVGELGGSEVAGRVTEWLSGQLPRS